jgi:hypothetical protein
MRARATLLGVLSLSLIVATQPGQAAEPEIKSADGVTRIAVDGLITGWVLDEPGGRLLASDRDGKQILPFDSATGQKQLPISLSHPAGPLVIKDRRLVVADESEGALSVVNLDTNKVEGTLQIDGGDVRQLVASRNDNPFIYALCGNLPDHRLLQIDIAERKVLRPVTSPRNALSQADVVVISPDGQMCAMAVGERFRHSGAAFFLLDEQQAQLGLGGVSTEAVRSGLLSAGPVGKLWTVGNQLMQFEPQPRRVAAEVLEHIDNEDQEAFQEQMKTLRRFAGAPVAIHPRDDLVVALGGGAAGADMTFQTLSSAQLIATIQLPNSTIDQRLTRAETAVAPDLRAQARAKAGGPLYLPTDGHPWLGFDATHGRAAFAWGRVAHLVDLQRLKKPLSAAFVLKAPLQAQAEVGQPWQVQLDMTHPDARKGARLKLENAPPGMTVDENWMLRWAPGANSVGTHVVQLLASAPERQDQQTLAVTVRYPGLQLPLLAQMLAVDPAGRYLAIAGVKPTPATDEDHFARQGREPAPTELALIDLKRQRLIARRTIEQGVRRLHVDDRAVYFAPLEGPAFHTLKLTDLANDKRIFTTGPVEYFQGLPAGLLLVATREALLCYRTDSFERAAVPALYRIDAADAAQRFDPLRARLAGRVFPDRGEADQRPQDWMGGGAGGLAVFCQGVILNDQTGAVQMTSGGSLMAGDRFEQLLARDREDGLASSPELWGRIASNQGLATASGRQLVTWEPAPSLILRKYPVLATAVVTMQERREVAELTCRLLFRELVEGVPREPLVLTQRSLDSGFERFMRRQMGQPLIADALDHVAVALDDQLFLIPLEKAQLSRFAEPLHFDPRQDPLQAEVGDVVEVKFKARGGQGGIRYSLPSRAPGLSIDAKSGTVRVDSAEVWKGFKERMAQVGLHVDDELEAHFKACRDDYRQLFGAKTEQLPLRVRLSVAAEDEHGQAAEVSSFLTLLGPSDEVTQAVAEAKLQTEKEYAAQRAAAAKRELANRAGAGNEAVVQQLNQLIDAQRTAAEKTSETEHKLSQLDQQLKTIAQKIAPPAEPAVDNKLLARHDAQVESLNRRLDEMAQQQSQARKSTLMAVGASMLATALIALLAVLLVNKRLARSGK